MSTGEKEKSVEDYLVKEAEQRGGVAIKMNPIGVRGLPDRLVLLPLGYIVFAELKRPKGGKLSTHQSWWGIRLQRLGFKWHVLHTQDAVTDMLTRYDNYLTDVAKGKLNANQ